MLSSEKLGLHRFFAVAFFSFVALAGCHRQAKPQPLVPPPMLPASAMIAVPEALPPANMKPIATPPAPAAATTASRPKSHHRGGGRRITDLSKAPAPTAASNVATPPAETATNSPNKITAPSRDVPTTAAISEGLPHSDEMHHKETAAQLNQSTEENLRSVTRTLTSTEKSIVEQIRSFMAQSQDAIADNDLVRAHNLALKAHLLSDELVHR